MRINSSRQNDENLNFKNQKIITNEIAMRINAHQPKMKLSLTNRHCSLFEWRIPSDLNLKNEKNNYR